MGEEVAFEWQEADVQMFEIKSKPRSLGLRKCCSWQVNFISKYVLIEQVVWLQLSHEAVV